MSALAAILAHNREVTVNVNCDQDDTGLRLSQVLIDHGYIRMGNKVKMQSEVDTKKHLKLSFHGKECKVEELTIRFKGFVIQNQVEGHLSSIPYFCAHNVRLILDQHSNLDFILQ